jgi:hypothetical protein
MLTLHDKWEIDSRITRCLARQSRLEPALRGARSAELLAGSADCPWSVRLEWLFSRTYDESPISLAQTDDARPLILDAGLSQMAMLTPLAFEQVDDFNFQGLVTTVESWTENLRDDPAAALACILYVELVFRLLHNDDMERALAMTAELCERFLAKARYKQELPRFKPLLDGSLKDCSRKELEAQSGLPLILKAAVWNCLNSATFEAALENGLGFAACRTEIAVVTGILAGLHFRGR